MSMAVQETMNYWKQVAHVLKYFRAEEDPKARLPQNFMTGFLEVSQSGSRQLPQLAQVTKRQHRRDETEKAAAVNLLCEVH